MITLGNALEGFKLVIGGFIQNLGLPIAMFISVRFPNYGEDEDRTTEVMWTMIALAIYHVALSAIRYWSLFKGRFWRAWGGIVVLGVIAINIWLRDRYLYGTSNSDLQEMITKDKSRQAAFYVWCYIEVAYFTSTFLTAGIFTLCRTFAKATFSIQSPLTNEENINVDFLEVESLFLDLLNLTTAPLLINLQLYGFCYNRFEDSPYAPDALEMASNVTLIVQMIMFLVSFHINRSSIFYSQWKNKHYVNIKYLVYACMYVCPAINILLMIVTMISRGSIEHPALMVSLWFSIGTIIWFSSDFLRHFRAC